LWSFKFVTCRSVSSDERADYNFTSVSRVRIGKLASYGHKRHHGIRSAGWPLSQTEALNDSFREGKLTSWMTLLADWSACTVKARSWQDQARACHGAGR